MSELKTLKDMNFMKQFEVKDELKQEAIKDIKIIKEAVKFKKDLDFLHEPTSEEGDAIISYIIEKNDLTEEDLEEKSE